MGICVTISCRYCVAFEVMLLFLVHIRISHTLANADYSASTGQTSSTTKTSEPPPVTNLSSQWSVCTVFGYLAIQHVCLTQFLPRQSWSDLSLQGPRRHSRINWIEETTRASSHYMASSSCQRLLSHSNRSFVAGDWPFKMETVHYGHLGYVSMMMTTITYFYISYSIYTHARQEPLCLHYQTAGQR